MPPPSGTTRVPVVAVVNTSQEITNLLEVLFQIEGFQVVTAFTLDIKEGRFDFDQLVRDHQPDAVVWDIAIPYEANWALFEQLAATPAGQRCRFILTTTNKLALRSLVGEVAVHELIGKPFDLDEIVGAVRRAMGDDLATQDSEGDHPSPDRTA